MFSQQWAFIFLNRRGYPCLCLRINVIHSEVFLSQSKNEYLDHSSCHQKRVGNSVRISSLGFLSYILSSNFQNMYSQMKFNRIMKRPLQILKWSDFPKSLTVSSMAAQIRLCYLQNHSRTPGKESSPITLSKLRKILR